MRYDKVRRKIMSLINSTSPDQLSILASVVAISLAKDKSANEVNVLGNFIAAVGAQLLTIAAQQESLKSQQEKENQIADLKKQIKDLKSQ
jgi:hypothetical protein